MVCDMSSRSQIDTSNKQYGIWLSDSYKIRHLVRRLLHLTKNLASGAQIDKKDRRIFKDVRLPQLPPKQPAPYLATSFKLEAITYAMPQTQATILQITICAMTQPQATIVVPEYDYKRSAAAFAAATNLSYTVRTPSPPDDPSHYSFYFR
eukprot:3470870-Rhodomonas_salina.1